MMNTLENNNHIKAGQKWEREARQRSGDMNKLIERLFSAFAASGGDFDILEAPLISILHERNMRLRQLRRKRGCRYRNGKFSMSPFGSSNATDNEIMSDLLVFAAFYELNLVLAAAFHIAELEAETNGSVSIPMGDGEEPFRVEVVNPAFLCGCVTEVVEQFLKGTYAALVALTLDVIDDEKAINFLCGRTSKRINLYGPTGTRVRDTLKIEYPDESGRGRLREVLLQELRTETSIKFASIKARPKLDDKLHQLTRLHTAVFSAIEKSIGQPISVTSRTVSTFDMIEEADQKHWKLNPEQEFLAKEILLGFKSLLSDRQYEVLMLRVEGYSSPEIADQLNMKAPTVDVQLHRARNKIKKAGLDLL